MQQCDGLGGLVQGLARPQTPQEASSQPGLQPQFPLLHHRLLGKAGALLMVTCAQGSVGPCFLACATFAMAIPSLSRKLPSDLCDPQM